MSLNRAAEPGRTLGATASGPVTLLGNGTAMNSGTGLPSLVRTPTSGTDRILNLGLSHEFWNQNSYITGMTYTGTGTNTPISIVPGAPGGNDFAHIGAAQILSPSGSGTSLVPGVGLEPTASAMSRRRSTAELPGQKLSLTCKHSDPENWLEQLEQREHACSKCNNAERRRYNTRPLLDVSVILHGVPPLFSTFSDEICASMMRRISSPDVMPRSAARCASHSRCLSGTLTESLCISPSTRCSCHIHSTPTHHVNRNVLLIHEAAS